MNEHVSFGSIKCSWYHVRINSQRMWGWRKTTRAIVWKSENILLDV